MDSLRGFDDERLDDNVGGVHDEGAGDGTVAIGSDERRMHVRAYNYWVSLLHGRAFPGIDELDPENIADFGPHSVLLDFTGGIEDPVVAYLGAELREECALDASHRRISDVPSRSLLSRLTDHYLQIIANKAPIGFEAEFVSMRGHNTLYRGILMPFSSTGAAIDFIYGVINWKELVDAETQAQLDVEVAAALRNPPRHDAAAPVWADGPGATGEPADSVIVATPGTVTDSLEGRLMLARETAAAAQVADTRSRAALYRALGRAYDFAIAAGEEEAGYQALLAEAGIAVQARAPMTPVVKLVFGPGYDKTRLTEFAAVLAAAKRDGIAMGALPRYLDLLPGGIKAMVAAERAHRASKTKPAPAAVQPADLAPIAQVSLPVESAVGELIVLLARACEDGRFDILASVGDNGSLTQQVIRAAA